MDLDFKAVLLVNAKWLFLLVGVILGLSLGIILMSFNRDLNVLELDLKKIIRHYASVASSSKKPMDEIQTDFKSKLDDAMQLIPAKTVVVKKGALLSKHQAQDYTATIISKMEINPHDQT